MQFIGCFRKFSLIPLITLLCLPAWSQPDFRLYAPADKSVTTSNMPVFSWQPTSCNYYELWIDGILMEKIPATKNACVPFPLSFGTHSWYVYAVQGDLRIRSNIHTLTIDDLPVADVPANARLLRHHWKVASSLNAGTDGHLLTMQKISTQDWATTSLPATVLTALVRNGIYPNPYYGMNNMLIPDASDAYNTDYNLMKFSHIPGVNPWKNPYWFYNEFVVPSDYAGKRIWLNFGEINYKAEVWLNGERIADTSVMIGMERQFRFDVTRYLHQQAGNILAVAIYPPDYPGKPAPEPLTPFADPGQNMADGAISRNYTKWDVMGWDWQPAVRDRDMGITEDVFLTATDAIELSDLYVTSDLRLPDTSFAEITASVTLINHSATAADIILKGSVTGGTEPIGFSLKYRLAAHETREIVLDKSILPALYLKNPRLWWPAGYGKQNLYTISLQAETDDSQKAVISSDFGIRKLETYIGNKERVFRINGRQVYLRGGNWVIDMMLNWNSTRYEEEIQLTKNAGLNILRVWGPTGAAPKALYEAADKHGILLWQDFLNDFWGTFKNTPGYQPDITLFEKATTAIIRKYRNHPSLIIWCGGNEGPNPREALITGELLPANDPRGNRHYLTQSDGDGLHGGGPYHTLEPAGYFKHPKLTGFSSEIGPSGVPELQSLLKFMPEPAKTWQPGRFPIDGMWAYHDANDWPGEDTRKFTSYDNIVRNFYGPPDSTGMEGFAAYSERCQLVNYDVYRAAIESINRQLWSDASGILLWKSNSSWPSATWQVYDWYLQAHAGYYGAKKAGEPLHIQLNRDNNSVSFINMSARSLPRVQVMAQLLNTKQETLWSMNTGISAQAGEVTGCGITVPMPENMAYLKLTATDQSGSVLSENLYWLSSTNDYRQLNELTDQDISIRIKPTDGDKTGFYQVTLKNNGPNIAFMLRMRIAGKESHQEMLPSCWSDNYFSLLPGEEKTVAVETALSGMLEEPVLQYKTYNMNDFITIDF